MVIYSHSPNMLKLEKQLKGKEEALLRLNKEKQPDEIKEKEQEIVNTCNDIFLEGLIHLKQSLLIKSSGKEKTGKQIREKCETDAKEGHYILRRPLGSGIASLTTELRVALYQAQPIFSDVSVSARQAEYLKFGFQRNDIRQIGHRTYGALPPLPTAGGEKVMIPTIGIVGRRGQFIAMPCLTEFLKSVIYTGFATSIPGNDYKYVQASLIRYKQGILEEEWKQSAMHTDYSHARVPKGKQHPLTFILCLEADLPLEFGSYAKKPTNKNVLPKEIILTCGDGVVFTSRQNHRTGTPTKFPTETNYRLHFMISNRLSDVSEKKKDTLYVHPRPENIEYYEAGLTPKT